MKKTKIKRVSKTPTKKTGKVPESIFPVSILNPEKAIQLQVLPGISGGVLYLLTDKGRVCQYSGGKWVEVKVPNFIQFDVMREAQLREQQNIQ